MIVLHIVIVAVIFKEKLVKRNLLRVHLCSIERVGINCCLISIILSLVVKDICIFLIKNLLWLISVSLSKFNFILFLYWSLLFLILTDTKELMDCVVLK
jgi:hypothetical protein